MPKHYEDAKAGHSDDSRRGSPWGPGASHAGHASSRRYAGGHDGYSRPPWAGAKHDIDEHAQGFRPGGPAYTSHPDPNAYYQQRTPYNQRPQNAYPSSYPAASTNYQQYHYTGSAPRAPGLAYGGYAGYSSGNVAYATKTRTLHAYGKYSMDKAGMTGNFDTLSEDTSSLNKADQGLLSNHEPNYNTESLDISDKHSTDADKSPGEDRASESRTEKSIQPAKRPSRLLSSDEPQLASSLHQHPPPKTAEACAQSDPENVSTKPSKVGARAVHFSSGVTLPSQASPASQVSNTSMSGRESPPITGGADNSVFRGPSQPAGNPPRPSYGKEAYPRPYHHSSSEYQPHHLFDDRNDPPPFRPSNPIRSRNYKQDYPPEYPQRSCYHGKPPATFGTSHGYKAAQYDTPPYRPAFPPGHPYEASSSKYRMNGPQSDYAQGDYANRASESEYPYYERDQFINEGQKSGHRISQAIDSRYPPRRDFDPARSSNNSTPFHRPQPHQDHPTRYYRASPSISEHGPEYRRCGSDLETERHPPTLQSPDEFDHPPKNAYAYQQYPRIRSPSAEPYMAGPDALLSARLGRDERRPNQQPSAYPRTKNDALLSKMHTALSKLKNPVSADWPIFQQLRSLKRVSQQRSPFLDKDADFAVKVFLSAQNKLAADFALDAIDHRIASLGQSSLAHR